ncbi:apolipophorin-3-like [Anopheles aquasalis]|uniref:apolipophorin-3-like n=1 Tax=Anopheles aquasalis TaxID=42839 RepID=UPI00215B3938|nr:apolipophorin-3-like [Anopheles aquasalis]
MAKLVYLILALCVVQGTFARVRRDAPAAPAAPEKSFFDNLLAVGGQITVAFEESRQNVLKSLGFQSDDEVVQTIKNNTEQYVSNLRTAQTTIQEELAKHSDVFDPIVKDLNAKLSETAATLSQQNPEVAQKAKEYQEQVQTNLQSLFAEAQKTVEKLKEDSRAPTEKLQQALKQIYDSTLETLNSTGEKVKQQAAN